MSDIQAVHTRYAAGSYNLLAFIVGLGYEECEVEGHGLSVVKTYKLGDTKKRIKTSFDEIHLFEIIDGKEISAFRGFTVHDELLKFFSKREIYTPKNKGNGINI
jgi:hypothetical protein